MILRKPVAGLSDTALAKFVARASVPAGLQGTVNVLVTGSSELRSLNRRFRGKDKPTDVLSFPPGPGFVNGLAGDIAISADIAEAECPPAWVIPRPRRSRSWRFTECFIWRATITNPTRARWRGKERQLRRSLGLPLGLIERKWTDGDAR